MNLKKLTSSKYTSYYGIIFPILLIFFITLSIYFSPWFSLNENWFSRLGGNTGETPIWRARGIGSLFFNIGMILSGFIGMLFAISLFKSKFLNNKSGKIAKYLLFFNMVSLCGIGIFPATILLPHRIFSAIFFALCPILIFFIRISMKKEFGNKLSLILNIFCLIGMIQVIIVFILPEFMYLSKALGEGVVTFSFFIFCFLFSVKLLPSSKGYKRIKKDKNYWTPSRITKKVQF